MGTRASKIQDGEDVDVLKSTEQNDNFFVVVTCPNHFFYFSFQTLVKRAIDYHSNPYIQPFANSKCSELRTENLSFCQIDGVLTSSPFKLNFKNALIRPALCPNSLQKEHKNYRDPNHQVVDVNGFVFCLGGIRKFGIGVSRKVQR